MSPLFNEKIFSSVISSETHLEDLSISIQLYHDFDLNKIILAFCLSILHLLNGRETKFCLYVHKHTNKKAAVCCVTYGKFKKFWEIYPIMTRLRIPHEFHEVSVHDPDSMCSKCSTATPKVCDLCGACFSCHSAKMENDY